MKRKWKKMKPIMAMLISIVMILEPLGCGVTAYAAEQGETVEEDMISEPDGMSGTEQNDSEEQLPEQETDSDAGEKSAPAEDAAGGSVQKEEPDKAVPGEAKAEIGSGESETIEAEEPTAPEKVESAVEDDLTVELTENNAPDISDLMADPDNIASGTVDQYGGYIQWVINKNGKLTVVGTGDVYNPWYDYRDKIISAEIIVSGMQNASLMFSGCENLRSVNLEQFDTSNVTEMTNMFYDCSSLVDLDVSHFDTSNVTNMSWMFWNCSSLTELDVSHFNTSNVTSMNGMFFGCSGLTNLDVSHFDTSNVIIMYNMFGNCSGLMGLDVSKFNTSNVIDMSAMFFGCSSLTDLDVSKFDTSKVTNMASMFSGLNLTNLDVSHFDTANVESMASMFFQCQKLASLDVSNFDTSKVSDMVNMFYDCISLKSLDLSSFDLSNVEQMYIFLPIYSSALTQINTPKNCKLDVTLPDVGITDEWCDSNNNIWDKLPKNQSQSIKLEKKAFYISRGKSEAEYGDITWVIDLNGKLTVEGSGNFAAADNNYTWRVPWNNYRTQITSAEIKVTGITSTFGMFDGCENLTEIDFKAFDTSGVANVSNMFNGCSSLTELDLSALNLSKITSAENCFGGCTMLKTIKTPVNCKIDIQLPKLMDTDEWQYADGTVTTVIPKNQTSSVVLTKKFVMPSGEIDEKYGHIQWAIDENWKLTVEGTGDYAEPGNGYGYARAPWYSYGSNILTAKINVSGMTNASGMFHGCRNLTSVDLTNFDTSKVTSMRDMFAECYRLTGLDVSHFDTSSVTDMSYMFSNCKGLTDLDASDFRTDNVTNMSYMFQGCSNLTSLDVSGFRTGSVKNMSYMFQNCSELTSLDVSKFDTGNVERMEHMFYGLGELTGLNVSGFNTSNVTDMGHVFMGCSSLTDLDVSGFDTGKVRYMSSMFADCVNLTNLDVSGFNTSKVLTLGHMFRDCQKVENLDVSGFDTSSATEIGSMFENCKNLTSLDVGRFDLGKVSYGQVYSMFRGCEKLTGLDLSNLDFNKFDSGNTLENMLEGCVSLSLIRTPLNLKQTITLPKATDADVWYFSDGSTTTVLPQNLDYSVALGKNEVPEENDTVFCIGTPILGTGYSEGKVKLTSNGSIISNVDAKWSFEGYSGEMTGHVDENGYLTLRSPILNFDISKTNKYNLKAEIYYKENGEWINTPMTRTMKVTVQFAGIAWGISRDVRWMIDDAGKLTVTGTGDCEVSDWNPKRRHMPWFDYRDQIKTAEVTVAGMENAAFMFAGCANLTQVDLSQFNTSSVMSMRSMFSGCSSLTSLDVSNFDTSNVDNMTWMFSGCSGLTSLDVHNINTSNVTDMEGMFSGCSGLTSLNVSNFDTSNVEIMAEMFSDCSDLTSLNVSNFDTSNVTEMWRMFAGCVNLTSLELGNLNTSQVEYLDSMFENCKKLISLDVSSFNMYNVKNVKNMFKGCEQLTSLDLSSFDLSSFDEENWNDGDGIFEGCISLSEIRTPLNLEKSVPLPKAVGTDVWYNSDGIAITELPQRMSYSILVKKNTIPEAEAYITATKEKVDYACGTDLSLADLIVKYHPADGSLAVDVTTFTTNAASIDMSAPGKKALIITYEGLTARITITVREVVSGDYENVHWSIDEYGKLLVEGTGDYAEPTNDCDRAPWHDHGEDIISAEIKVSGMTDASGMFHECWNLTSVDFTAFDTSKVTSMHDMFTECNKLTGLDVSHFDTSNVTDMSYMFVNCRSLTSLDVSKFNTSKVQRMEHMFDGCRKVSILDVSRFDTSNVVDMGDMFLDCNSLISLDVSRFNTSKVEYMGRMFYGCENLETLDVSGFDTRNVLTMGEMFRDCKKVKALDVSGFNTSKAEETGNMFENCKSVTVLDVSHFDLSGGGDALDMFKGCEKLTSLNLSSFDLGSFDDNDLEWVDMRGMLEGCVSLSEVRTPLNLKQTVPLPKATETDKWYDIDGNTVTELPKNLDHSIRLKKNEIPKEPAEELTVIYTVTFDSMGGSEVKPVPVAAKKAEGADKYVGYLSTIPQPQKEGYIFKGWFPNQDGTGAALEAGTPITGNAAYYAKWEAKAEEPVPDPDPVAVKGVTLDQTNVILDVGGTMQLTAAVTPADATNKNITWNSSNIAVASVENGLVNAIAAGTARITVTTEDGHFTASCDVVVRASEKETDFLWIADISDCTYCGTAVKPDVRVYFGNILLEENVDYTVSYKNNTKAASAAASKAPTASVTGKGNYSGVAKRTFSINSIDMSDTRLVSSNFLKGKAYTPVVAYNGEDSDFILKAGTDYTIKYDDGKTNQPLNAGEHIMTLEGRGSCEGTTVFNYTIGEEVKSIAKAVAVVPAMTFGGDLPSVSLKLGEDDLSEPEDYITVFANTGKKGTAKVTFVGVGDYCGTKTVSFKVKAAAIQDEDVDVEESTAYEKGGAKPKVSVEVDGRPLISGVDYTVSYSKNGSLTEAAKVTIKGKGNYTGKVTKTFAVTGKDLCDEKIQIYVSDVKKGAKPAVTIYDANGKKLKAKKDYKAVVDLDDTMVTITGGTNKLYTASSDIEIAYREVSRENLFTSAKLKRGYTSYIYNGEPVTLESERIEVKIGKQVIGSDEYEIIGYVNNTNKGTATAVIRAKEDSEYGGLRFVDFKIKTKSFQ